MDQPTLGWNELASCATQLRVPSRKKNRIIRAFAALFSGGEPLSPRLTMSDVVCAAGVLFAAFSIVFALGAYQGRFLVILINKIAYLILAFFRRFVSAMVWGASGDMCEL